MSLAVVYSRALLGLDAPLVRVEVHVGGGLPETHIVGLPEKEVRESRDRVRAALQTANYERPQGRVTVSLAPADLPKESGRFDLPIAIGILAATGQVPKRKLEGLEFAGELGLSGELRPIRGALAMTFRAHRDGRAFVLPEAVASEAALARSATILPARTLAEVCAHLSGAASIARFTAAPPPSNVDYPDLADVHGQVFARRALEIAAAGGHSLLMRGPPGTGKTMLAQRVGGILPPMTEDEALEAAAVQSLAGFTLQRDRFGQRVFRAPHHTASAVALVGGGSPPRPGEVSLAHHGVLFLDELPEFSRHVLEVLREPLESGRITISRAARQSDFPAAFQLIAAMNPCPCGYRGHPTRACNCAPDKVAHYLSRISGPLLDRVDLHVSVPALRAEELDDAPAGEASERVRARVVAARERQLARQGVPNARLSAAALRQHAGMEPRARSILRDATVRKSLSARSYQRILRVARTIADMDHAVAVAHRHVAEALLFRD